MSEKDVELDIETGEEIQSPEPTDKAPQVQDQDDDDHGEEGHSDGDDGDDGDDHGEESVGDTDEEREAIRARRREERKQRKQAQREREDSLRRELAARDAVINELRGKVEGIERRNTGSEIAQLETMKQQTANAYAYFKDQIRVATEANNGAAVAEATEKMLIAQQRFNELQNIEKAYRQRQAAPQPLDPRLAQHAQTWMSQNKWYDPSGKDPDSRITLTIDQQLADEGWDPSTEGYWKELNERVKKYLPHRVSSGKIDSRRPKPVVTGTSRESVPNASKGTYKLSADRVQALKDAGIWEDPKQRAEAIKRFREFDKQNNQG